MLLYSASLSRPHTFSASNSLEKIRPAVHPDSFTRRLRKIYQRNNFPKEYHLHTLRHFFATYLLEHNLSKQVAADLLGHADTAFLERTYCHPQQLYKQVAADIFNDFLRPQEEREAPKGQLIDGPWLDAGP